MKVERVVFDKTKNFYSDWNIASFLLNRVILIEISCDAKYDIIMLGYFSFDFISRF